jgi:Methylamine utilisation protein MauE
VAILATTVALVGASILLWAALEKARDPASTASTLRQLGAPASLANAAGLIILAELAVALGLVFRPDSAVTQAGVVLLAGAFALAGLLALRRDEPVRCTCFGSRRSGYLGANQVLALVPWVGGALFLYIADVAPPSPPRGAALLAGVGLAMAGVRLVPVLGAWREARGDRRSAQETYLWLHR